MLICGCVKIDCIVCAYVEMNINMVYKIELIEKTEIIKVTYCGDVSLDDRLNAVHELCRNYHLYKRFKLLIDSTHATEMMTKNEQIIFGRYLTKREEFRGALVATLVSKAQSITKVIVQEAASLGYQITSFHHEEEALSWLNNTN